MPGWQDRNIAGPSNLIITRYNITQFCIQYSNIKGKIYYIFNSHNTLHLTFVGEFWCHDVAMTWKHFRHYWPFVRGIHCSLIDFTHKGSVMWKFDVYDLDLCAILSSPPNGVLCWCSLEQTVGLTVELPVIGDVMLIWCLCNDACCHK